MPQSIQSIIDNAATRLPDSDSPRADIEILLQQTLNKPHSFLFAHPEHELSPTHEQQFAQLCERRAQGEPIAHITGLREFWSLILNISADTLIPRPETEHLVEQALLHIPELDPEQTPEQAQWHIADLGTGSGAIALAIAHERPLCHVTAIDSSAKALAVAQQNAVNLKIDNISFIENNWLEGIDEQFHLIVSNPPYIAEHDPHLSQGDLRFEPRSALSSGYTGMDDINTLALQARSHLHQDGWLLIEHGYDQKQAVIDCLKKLGYRNISDVKDYAGNDRIAIAQY